MKNFFCLSSALVLVACATTYNSLDGSEPHATLRFEDGKAEKSVGFGTSLSHQYLIYENTNCDNPQMAADFSWGKGQTKDVRITPNKAVKILSTLQGAGHKDQPGNIYAIATNDCSMLLEFTPKEGKTYLIKGTGTASACDLKIHDGESGNSIADAQVSKVEIDGRFRCEN